MKNTVLFAQVTKCPGLLLLHGNVSCFPERYNETTSYKNAHIFLNFSKYLPYKDWPNLCQFITGGQIFYAKLVDRPARKYKYTPNKFMSR